MFRNAIILSLLLCTFLACGGNKKELASVRVGWQQGLGSLPDDQYDPGSVDSTLQFPSEVTSVLEPSVLAMNDLPAWSGLTPLEFSFSTAIQSHSATAGQAVRLFYAESSNAAGRPIESILDEIPAADYSVSISGSKLSIQPAAPTAASTGEISPSPFRPGSTIVAVLTTALKDINRDSFQRTAAYAEQLAVPHPDAHSQAYQAQYLLQLLQAEGLAQGSVLHVQSFTVQTLGTVLGLLRDVAFGGEAAMFTEGELDSRFAALDIHDGAEPGLGLPLAYNFLEVAGAGGTRNRVFQGVLELPYLLGRPSQSTDTTFLTQPWQSRFTLLGDLAQSRAVTPLNPLPALQNSEKIPILVSLPTEAAPPGGYPVVLFQHGYQGSRVDSLNLAATFGFGEFLEGAMAVVAIDLPLHGVDPFLHNEFYTGRVLSGVHERTFGVDAINNNTGALGADGFEEPSGHWFLNLENPAVARDHYRQSVADLLSVLGSLASIDADGDSNPDFDLSQVTFLGHSLGASLGVTLLNLDLANFQVQIQAATLAMPGASLMGSFRASQLIGPNLESQLLALGLVPDSAEYNRYLWFAQTMLDVVEPAAAAGDAMARGQADEFATLFDVPLHLIEVVGDGLLEMPDKVMPNAVSSNPWVGTEPLISLLGLDSISTTPLAGPIRGSVRFVAGHHGSIITPLGEDGFANTTAQSVYDEMSLEAYWFLKTLGNQLPISDETLVLQPE
ncbi:MAG: hypothetical protein HN405_01235 [Planctomycetes bacterium]|jgi:hypothetical protein|nr:hypothetical protein [Planctomycetota bacterium]MBT4029259.1 hypothetical protein [Planctomycetota bacterium]MBT4560788.1 hypothetical protein [Planctomycetota bacterium]MBT5101846.1 hypothetical protein [Planctomycetota bacterium]MBT7012770.1 hypothetical protein [Planctomycetota bacterium]